MEPDHREQLLREVLAERFTPRPPHRPPMAPIRREPIEYHDTDLDQAERRRVLNNAISGAEPSRTPRRREIDVAPVVGMWQAS